MTILTPAAPTCTSTLHDGPLGCVRPAGHEHGHEYHGREKGDRHNKSEAKATDD